MEAEVKLRAIVDARRNRHTQAARNERMAVPVAGSTRFSPCFASAAAFCAGRTKKDDHRNHGTAARFAARETDLRPDGLGAFAGAVGQERSAHTSHEVSDRRKIDRDLICEAIRLPFKSHVG